MASKKYTYYSKLYRDFKEIDQTAYQDIIRFYEDREEAIRKLDFYEYFEAFVSYVNALFQVGAYQSHLLMVDVLIETVIEENIRIYKGKDLFKDALFKKAASYFNIHEFHQSEQLLQQYIRIYPNDEQGILFLKKCLRKQRPTYLNNAHAITIFVLLLTALVIAIEVLFVRPFYNMHTSLIEQTRNSMFFFACSVLVGATLYQRWQVELQVERFVKEIRDKQKG